ncbi:MAG: hypothetical protein JZU60_00550 [Ilumatobacteraceae bacterium]|jgi:hypothetical protein|nr:hypothetical protein [Ilumatobacteraceae bacterium]
MKLLISGEDLRDQAALDIFEADITAMRMAELLNHPIQGKFDLTHPRPGRRGEGE